MTDTLPPMIGPQTPAPTFKSSRSQPETPETSGQQPSTADDAAHLSDIVVPDIDDGDIDEDAPRELDQETGEAVALDAAPIEPEQIDKDAFFVVFKIAFDLPPQFVPELAPLAIAPEEEQSARAASDAIHSLLEIWYPRALLPGSETIGHLLMILPFLMAKAAVVRQIIAAQKAKQVNPEPEGKQPAHEPQDARLVKVGGKTFFNAETVQ